jgi:hypothetical protein
MLAHSHESRFGQSRGETFLNLAVIRDFRGLYVCKNSCLFRRLQRPPVQAVDWAFGTAPGQLGTTVGTSPCETSRNSRYYWPLRDSVPGFKIQCPIRTCGFKSLLWYSLQIDAD